MNPELKNLIGKLNEVCRDALSAAVGQCVTRANYSVELEHWLGALLESENSDIAALCRFYEVDVSRFRSDITHAIDQMSSQY